MRERLKRMVLKLAVCLRSYLFCSANDSILQAEVNVPTRLDRSQFTLLNIIVGSVNSGPPNSGNSGTPKKLHKR